MKNADRRAQTRAKLIAAARTLFEVDGFQATSTEAILQAAGVARGALYHHFRDKAELFEAVCRQLVEEASEAIGGAVEDAGGPFDHLAAGSLAWIAFMRGPAARQVLVIDAPSVLGFERWYRLDDELSVASLRQGVDAALDAGELRFEAGGEALTQLLNGMMNAIALADPDARDLEAGYIEVLHLLRPLR